MTPTRASGQTSRFLPFNSSTTSLQAATYLLGISLFSISFLVFLNSTISFVITDLLGLKKGVGDIVGTLGFADELVALVACPLWGLLSDRLGVRWVAVLGYTIIAVSLWVFVECRDVYPALILARILFAVGATAAATMVTAILPVLTDDDERNSGEQGKDDGVHATLDNVVSGQDRPETDYNVSNGDGVVTRNARGSIAVSLASDVTITPERFTQDESVCPALESSSPNQTPGSSAHGDASASASASHIKGKKTSALAGFVGVFTGCGALLALSLFLPLPAQFSKKDGVTPAQAITYSFRVVGTVALAVAVFVFWGLRGLRGEETKGWRALFGLKDRHASSFSPITIQDNTLEDDEENHRANVLTGKRTGTSGPLPYHHLLISSLRLGGTDPHIALGYLGGFVARASTVAISLFLPLYVNAYYMSQGFCQGSPNDPSPDLKRECRAAYVLAASLSGVAQLIALFCAPVFGYVNARRYKGVNWGVLVATSLGIVGYLVFPRLVSPEFRNIDGRGGSPVVFLVVSLLGISQIGAIVCSLGSLGHGILGEDVVINSGSGHSSSWSLSTDERGGESADEENEGAGERQALLENTDERTTTTTTDATRKAISSKPGEIRVSRVQLKGSVAGVYSWCGGAAILLLTKLGGYLFDALSTGAPFYMMAIFNAILLSVSLFIDLRSFARNR